MNTKSSSNSNSISSVATNDNVCYKWWLGIELVLASSLLEPHGNCSTGCYMPICTPKQPIETIHETHYLSTNRWFDCSCCKTNFSNLLLLILQTINYYSFTLVPVCFGNEAITQTTRETACTSAHRRSYMLFEIRQFCSGRKNSNSIQYKMIRK